MTLSVSVCIEENCESTPILSDRVIPIPICNDGSVLSLAGSGTIIDDFLRYISGLYNGTMIDTVLNTLGIKVKSRCNTN